MADVLFLLIVVAFFGFMVALVHACDRIIGPDELTVPSDSDADSVSTGGDVGDPVESEAVGS